MVRRLTVMAITIIVGTCAASAQSQVPRNPDSEYTESLYATDQHMAFSIRSAVIRWLGGVDVARERDTKAAEKEGCWGIR